MEPAEVLLRFHCTLSHLTLRLPRWHWHRVQSRTLHCSTSHCGSRASAHFPRFFPPREVGFYGFYDFFHLFSTFLFFYVFNGWASGGLQLRSIVVEMADVRRNSPYDDAKRYDLLKKLGSGTGGVVHLAQDRNTRRMMAIKVMDFKDKKHAVSHLLSAFAMVEIFGILFKIIKWLRPMEQQRLLWFYILLAVPFQVILQINNSTLFQLILLIT